MSAAPIDLSVLAKSEIAATEVQSFRVVAEDSTSDLQALAFKRCDKTNHLNYSDSMQVVKCQVQGIVKTTP